MYVTDGFRIYGNAELDSCLIARLFRDTPRNPNGGFGNNKPGTCTPVDVCKEITLSGYTDKVYQCRVSNSFAGSRAYCKQLDASADLYWAESTAEWATFQAAVQAGTIAGNAWLGYTDEATTRPDGNGPWLAVSGFTGYDPTAEPNFWEPGEPNGGNNENFIQLYGNGHANDLPGGNELSALCRVPSPSVH